jgi:hypothetical protein
MYKFAPNLAPETDFRKVNNPIKQNILSSSPGEGGSCSSETKHDRRTAPRPKLFVSTRRIQR